MTAAEALAVGLVARVVEPSALEALAAEIAQSIAAAPALAMQLTKHCVDQGARTDLQSGIRIEIAAIERNLAQSDWRGEIAKFSAEVGSSKPG